MIVSPYTFIWAYRRRHFIYSSLNKPTVCTMKSSTDFCKLPGKYGYKWPTLQELYKILFGEGFGNAHNSLSDIQATKKCYFKLKALGIIN